MKNISELKAKQIRIFAPGMIPFVALRTAIGQKSLSALFAWTEVQMSSNGELVFSSGTFQQKESAPIIINSLQINERRLILEVLGDTAQADEVYRALLESLLQFDNSGLLKDALPIVVSNETSCVAALDFDWTCLISPRLLEFGRKLELELSTKSAKAEIIGLRSALVFSFTIQDEAIRENGISLSPKPFIIEPRASIPLSERRYLTSSPTDTKNHMQLLSKLERSLASKKRNMDK